MAELHGAAGRLESKNATPSLDGLRAEGVSEEAIRRAIIVEFGSEKAAFDAISPEYYVVAGKPFKLTKAGTDFF